MTTDQYHAMQAFLMEAQNNFILQLKSVGLPTHLCLHIAPDMCWISEEHEYQKEYLTSDVPDHADIVTICNRKPPACHAVLVKL